MPTLQQGTRKKSVTTTDDGWMKSIYMIEKCFLGEMSSDVRDVKYIILNKFHFCFETQKLIVNFGQRLLTFQETYRYILQFYSSCKKPYNHFVKSNRRSVQSALGENSSILQELTLIIVSTSCKVQSTFLTEKQFLQIYFLQQKFRQK